MDEYIKNLKVDTNFLNDVGNGIMLSKPEEDILSMYNIDYKNCSSVQELIFRIEDYLNEVEEVDELDLISSRLSEYNYYNNTNK